MLETQVQALEAELVKAGVDVNNLEPWIQRESNALFTELESLKKEIGTLTS